ncbi:MAG: RagB/SusD family nutrient uptake outer membrane protein, partial [Bacteroidota bacterium]|nr:RagB/SusD family nutrient uptake outer membrane protein [Bacteroidota bacterium]
SLCNWGPFYQVINIANVVLANAEKAKERDETYKQEELNSNYCEAYFLRALTYFYLVRNWREVPLITVPFEDDSHSYRIAKSSESEIIKQIKSDVEAALATGAAKEAYETTWETKGRATKWALYALMADVCLWSEDYDKAIEYCDYLLNATSAKAPVLLSTPTHDKWFSMFNPGNSNESIFEIQWSYERKQTNTLPILFDNLATDRLYQISQSLLTEFNAEYTYTFENQLEAVRTMYGGYYTDDPAGYDVATKGYVWKYCGAKTYSEKRTQTYYDPNFIIYRMAEIYLMKAEALVLRSDSREDWKKALELVNDIRTRSNLAKIEYTDDLSEQDMLGLILYERRMEFVGEGKSWYDILRFGRRNNNKYKSVFLVENVTKYNKQASESWLNSVLSNDDALFLPIAQSELKANSALVQNPYYY